MNVNPDWDAISGDAQILNKPSTYAPSAHPHPISDVTSLQTTLDGKAPALGADDNYVTDAEKVKLSNLSGTNTGDQTLPTRASLSLDTIDSPQFTGINLGHASDTPLPRVSAGVVAVEGVQLATGAGAALLTTAFSGLAKITVGTVEPTSPSTGDLRVDTN